MSWERPCDLCRVFVPISVLVRVDVFPLGLVCEPCEAELRADDEHPAEDDDAYAGEPDCGCHHFCRICTPGA